VDSRDVGTEINCVATDAEDAVEVLLDEIEEDGLSRPRDMSLVPFCSGLMRVASRFFTRLMVSSGSRIGDVIVVAVVEEVDGRSRQTTGDLSLG
jgi:hypothetical protein